MDEPTKFTVDKLREKINSATTTVKKVVM